MTFNIWTFLFEAINFVVLAYVLHRLLYRPLREAIEQRREATLKAQTAAENARQEANAIQQKLQLQLAGLEQQRQETIHQAREQASEERKKLVAETEQMLKKRQEEMHQTLARERSEALKALQAEVIAQAVELARRLLNEASEQTLHRQLSLRMVQALRELPETERERIRDQWQSGDGVVLETAQELDEATLAQVKKSVMEIVGRQAALTVQTKPALLDGVRLRIGGHVWDGSLSGQLREANQVGLQETRP